MRSFIDVSVDVLVQEADCESEAAETAATDDDGEKGLGRGSHCVEGRRWSKAVMSNWCVGRKCGQTVGRRIDWDIV